MRLDQILVQRGLAEDEKKAQSLILGNQVLVNDEPQTKAGFEVADKDAIRLRLQRQWVSRAAEKLQPVLQHWDFPVQGKNFLDVGASTGGFTQVLLHHGAREVMAIDVGYGLLHPVLRDDVRVVLKERTNICHFDLVDLKTQPDSFVMDVSFIHPLKVLRHLRSQLVPWQGIMLFKPQFAAVKNQLQRGIVLASELEAICIEFEAALEAMQIEIREKTIAAVKGAKGNQEFLYWLKWR